MMCHELSVKGIVKSPGDPLRGQKGAWLLMENQMNESFVFYRSFAKALEKLPADQYKEVMTAVCQYGLDGSMPELSDPILDAIFLLIQPQIDANNKRRESGKKGAESRWNDSKQMADDSKGMADDSKQMATSCDAMPNVNANVNVNVNDKDNNTVQVPESDGPVEVKDKEKKKHSEVTEERFERFWKVYPRRQGKGDARKAFAKINPSEALLGQMLTAVIAASASFQWKKDGGQFIPLPATWLNQERWLDEVRPDMGKPDLKQAPPGKNRFANFEQRPFSDEDEAIGTAWLQKAR